MNVYCIAKRPFIQDLSGEGARRFGGRWSKRGSSVLYTASSRALATVEYLVHLPMALAPKDLCIAELSVPDELTCQQIDIATLPDGWQQYPALQVLIDMGEQWLRQQQAVLLKVPSAVVRDEWNVLLNPSHPDFSKIQIQLVESFQFDQRLLRR